MVGCLGEIPVLGMGLEGLGHEFRPSHKIDCYLWKVSKTKGENLLSHYVVDDKELGTLLHTVMTVELLVELRTKKSSSILTISLDILNNHTMFDFLFYLCISVVYVMVLSFV